MKGLVALMLVAALAFGMSACGNKGKLKSPTQMELAAQKKAKKAAAQQDESPAVPVSPSGQSPSAASPGE